MGETLLKMSSISKSFGATHALKGVDLDIEKGEVHMLLGENGAGKSTLMKILAGSLNKDSGTIYWEGEETDIKNPSVAHTLGIGMVYQELALIDDLRVFENILVGHLPKYKSVPFINWKLAMDTAREILDKVGLKDIDLKKRLVEYNLGTRQLIEIAKALSRKAKLLILDEPTSALTESEVNKLFAVIRSLKAEGVAFVFITHKLEEVFKIGDRVTIFRDGAKVSQTKPVSEISEDQMITDMVGRTITEFFPKEHNVRDEYLLEVVDFSDGKYFKDVSFKLKAGEVLGVAGLIGSGRTEIAEALFGMRKHTTGEIIYVGEKFTPKSPDISLKNRIGLLTKNRKSGLLLHMPIYRNVTLSVFDRFSKYGFRNKKLEFQEAGKYVDMLRIATNNIKNIASSLSGGNQQKVIISKLICADCKIFIFDDPTRGIDVGAKVEVYKLMNELTKNGAGIIFISSEMPELLGMSDRLLVARDGTIVADMLAEESTQEIIMRKIAGGVGNE